MYDISNCLLWRLGLSHSHANCKINKNIQPWGNRGRTGSLPREVGRWSILILKRKRLTPKRTPISTILEVSPPPPPPSNSHTSPTPGYFDKHVPVFPVSDETEPFMRTGSQEEVHEYWVSVRSELTQDYKRKRKDAVRRQNKLAAKRSRHRWPRVIVV